MTVLEFAADEKIGLSVLLKHPEIAQGLQQIESSLSRETRESLPDYERKRVKHILDLCFEYDREMDSAERENIVSTLLELTANAPLDLPKQTLADWEQEIR